MEELKPCPCKHIDPPCKDTCTCANPVMSGGCDYCCTYGSVAQQELKAILLSDAIQAWNTRSEDNWISVEKKLPEDNKDVLVCNIKATNNYAFPYTVKESYRLSYFENGKWHCTLWCDDDPPTYSDITHWQPLPEPPKDK